MYPLLPTVPMILSFTSGGLCSFNQHVTSSLTRFLYTLFCSVISWVRVYSPRETGTRDYSFIPAQCLAKPRCSLTVHIISPSLPCWAVCYFSRFSSGFPSSASTASTSLFFQLGLGHGPSHPYLSHLFLLDPPTLLSLAS